MIRSFQMPRYFTRSSVVVVAVPVVGTLPTTAGTAMNLTHPRSLSSVRCANCKKCGNSSKICKKRRDDYGNKDSKGKRGGNDGNGVGVGGAGQSEGANHDAHDEDENGGNRKVSFKKDNSKPKPLNTGYDFKPRKGADSPNNFCSDFGNGNPFFGYTSS